MAMVLQTHFLSSFTIISNIQHFSHTQPNLSLTIRSEKASESSDSEPKKPGSGFGSSNESGKRKQKQKGQRERASIIRRSPVEKPSFVSEQQVGETKEQGKNESAFILAWLGFGSIILVEGIALAASGFLPEEWDKFFVKYLYPSFTPTVFLFIAGAVAYGVFKYMQNEKITEQK
ncbi:protein LPA2 [Gastrolobium bilobum]|uniref:protein LPA2 n=1 Tax=Gastrolobium bilobum TaxID=150636 RepID=UPI002AB20DDA|nr:protein LPA2 [Gastrolobium bilobum]